VQTVVYRPIPEASTRVAELKAGRVDIVQDVPPDQVKALQAAGFSVVAKDAPQEAFIFLVSNVPDSPLAEKRVRQALNYGVDVDSIIKNVLQGYARRIASPIGPLTLGYDESVQPYPYDLAKAKALLKEANYEFGFDVVIDATNSDKTLTTEAVAGELAKLNVRATIRQLDLGTFNDNWSNKRTSPLVAARWSGLFDPASALNFFAKSDGLLTRYQRVRQAENLLMFAATDGLGRLFGTKHRVVRATRDLGIGAVDRTTATKRMFMRQAMGLATTGG